MTTQTSDTYGIHSDPRDGWDTASLRTLPTANEKLGALIAHAGTFVAWTIAPLVVYVLKKDDSKFVAFHALQSLLWSVAGTVLAALTCGLAIPVFMVFHAIAVWQTLHEREYEYPLVGEVARQIVYGR